MSSLTSEPAALRRGALTRRLSAALCASIALHGLVGGALGSLGAREPRGDPAGWAPGSLKLRAELRPAAGRDDGIRPAASPAADAGPAERKEPARARARQSSPLAVVRYYTTRELDVVPGILVRVMPEYPEAAAQRMLSGRVLLRLLVDSSGAVEKATSVRAEPAGVFEEAAERAFRAARFTPGLKDGRAVPVEMLIEVSFEGGPPPVPPSQG